MNAPNDVDLAAPAAGSAAPDPGRIGRPWLVAAVAVAVMAIGAIALSWHTQQRVTAVEAELVRRQQDSAALATEARVLAREAAELARDAAAKVALLEARVAETVLQRSQLEDLMQSLARSRDDGALAELDTALRVAQQQALLTGSAEPLVQALTQADERLARLAQPRLAAVRRAVAQDLDRARAAIGTADTARLALRLDEAMRQVDGLPLLVEAAARASTRGRAAPPATGAAPVSAPAPGAAASAPAAATATATATGDGSAAPAAVDAGAGWRDALAQRWQGVSATVWQEVRALVRVSRIEQPEALLLAPEQAFFVRENLKLRLLNARLALLSRQFDTAQADLRDAQEALVRWFDPSARPVVALRETLQQVSVQARQVTVPRPEASLAALGSAMVGR